MKMKLFYSLMLLCLPFIGIAQSNTTYNRSAWTVTPSSEELTGDLPNGPATKLLDGDNASFWVSGYTVNFTGYPYTLVFDMQVAQPVNQLYTVARDNSGTSAYSGSVSFGDDGINFGTELPVIFSAANAQTVINLPAIQNHRYFRITVTQNYDDHNAGANNEYITTLAEVGAIYNNTLDAGLSSFTVQAQAGGVKLDWSTSFEFNSTNYNITRSNDAVNFTTVGTLAATGTATTAATYTFTDAAPLTGFNFYRLELANSTGPATKSAIKNAEFPLITYSSNQPKNLNVFYFIPAGKAPWPDFKNRLDTLLINLQTYYKDEMQRNGINKTFGMVTDATHKKAKIIVVHGKYPISNYLSIGGGGTAAIQAEIDAYMAANPSPYYSSHSLMIAPVVGYDVATATIDEGVPVGGTGKNCHVIDNPELKWSWLGRDNSPESFNATYQIGAWAHEFGHAVGLPHNFLKVSEGPTLGTSLMSNGNSTFGRSTTTLTHTDAAILNHNQLFNDGSISYYGPNKASISSVHACYSASKNAIVVAGRVSTIGAQVTDVEIYNDPSNGNAPGVGDNNDYDAVAWTTPIIGTDSFYVEMPVTELQVRDSSLYQMRFRLVQLDGNLSDFRYNYDFANNIPELTDPAFTPINAKITASAGANGSISPAGVTTISCVGNQTYTITPASGYAVQSVLVDGAPAGAITTYTFTGVNTQHTISATFVLSVACSPNTWTGTTSTLWSVPTNWDCGTVPASGENVTIPDVANDPVLDGNITVGNIAIATGATVSIGSNTFTINGAASGTGTLSGTATSTLTTGATTTVRFTPAANTLKNLNVTAGTTTLGNAVNITGGTAANTFGTVTVASGAVLASAGNLTIKSNQFGTARVAAGAIAGNYITGDVTVERYIPANAKRAWRLLSVPTKGTKTIKQTWQENQGPSANGTPGFGTIITSNIATAAALQLAGFDAYSQQPSMQSYTSATQVWNYVTSTQPAAIETNKGYFIYIRGDRSLNVSSSTSLVNATTLRTTGTLYQGNSNPAITIAAGKYEPVGNTFASAISFTGLAKTGGISNTFYVWDAKLLSGTSLGAYQTFNGAVGFTPATPGGSYPSGQANTSIESGEAIMIGATGTAGTVALVEASKTTGNQFNPFRPSAAPAQFKTSLYRVNGTENLLADNNIVVFDNVYANAVDADDAGKLFNSAENLSIVRDNKDLIIEARKALTDNDVIYLSMTNLKAQQYKFEFSTVNMNSNGLTAYLEDKYLGTSTAISLQAATEVNFTADATVAAAVAKDRFKVVFKAAKAVATVTPGFTIFPNPAEGALVKVQFNNQPQGKYQIKLLNTAGQILFVTNAVHAGGSAIQVVSLPAGISAGAYQLQLVSPDKTAQTLKLFINSTK